MQLTGLSAGGTLENGDAHIEAATDILSLDRDGRRLDLGALKLRVQAGSNGLRVQSVDLFGNAISLHGEAEVSTTEPYVGTAELSGSVDLSPVMTWWDPELAAQATPRGRLDLQGRAVFDESSGLELEFEHSGETVIFGGYEVDTLGVTHRDRHTHARIGLAERGRIEIDADDDGRLSVRADLDHLPMDPTLSLVNHPIFAHLPAGLELSSRLEAEVRMPFSVAAVSADGWLRINWPQGHIEVSGRGTSQQWDVEKLTLMVPGATASASGSGRTDSIAAEVGVDAHDPGALIDFLDLWRPGLTDFGVGGGPFAVSAVVEGSVSEPAFTGSGLWRDPEVAGRTLNEVQFDVAGGIDSLDWKITALPVPGARLSVEGTTLWGKAQTTGLWTLDLPELGAVAHALNADSLEMWGIVEGGGRFFWNPEQWLVDGDLDARDVGGSGWSLDSASLRFRGSPDSIILDEFRLATAGGIARATASLEPATLDGHLEADVNLEDFDLGKLGSPVGGAISGNLSVAGSPANPEGYGMVAWVPPADILIAGPLIVSLRLSAGVTDLDISGWETAAGPISGQAFLPMGDLPRPEWLWPDAPGGPIRAHFDGFGLRSAPVVEALDLEPLPVEVSGDLSVDLEWDPRDFEHRFLLAEVEGLRVTGSQLDMTTSEKVRLKVEGQRVELEPLTLEGPLNRMHMGGVYEMDSTRLVGGLELDIDPSFLEMLPVPLQARGAVKVRVGVDGPVDTATAAIEVDHTGGSFVFRDPAVRLTDLRISAEVDDGVLWIQDGEAGLNRGRVLMGGGWDPESGQGVVFELDQVTALLTSGIVTNWSGTIAVEPSPEHAALVVGELDLNAGLWERTFNLTEAFMGTSVIETESSEILADIALDLQVRGYGGVRVNNNLGSFDASWGLLEIGGTAERPEITGGLRLAPGGTVNLPGQTVTIRSAQVDFTGNPDTDPSIEIIPESLGSGSLMGDGSSVDTQALAAEGLARGLGSVLGMENTTLQPAEIALETQTDATSAFTAGTRLSRTVALFFTTDLSNVQNQTTMLQLWNLRGLPGLALQGYSRTQDDDVGFNAIERYRWGGTEPSDEEPIIQRIKMEGDWPVGRRRLQRATGLRRGEPYDPFLLFAAGLNLEAELASVGYPRARVTAEAVGNERLPVLIFSAELGPKQEFSFVGDIPPEHVRRAAVGQYLPDPLESRSLREMSRTIRVHFLSDGYPQATVAVERLDDVIVVDSIRGEAVALVGPVVEGVPKDIGRTIQTFLGSPVELAQISQDPDRAAAL